MKNIYRTILLTALSLVIIASASAQRKLTVESSAHKDDFKAKGNFTGHAVTPSLLRGGGPDNDECAGAMSMTVGGSCVAVAIDATGATQSLVPNTCSNYLSPSANDTWYTFTATGTITIVSVTGSAGSGTDGYDAILEVYTGACGSLESITCVDASGRGGTESLTLSTVVGTTYTYRVYHWGYGTPQVVGDLTTCVYTPENVPANDLCENAVVQFLANGSSVTFTGDNTGALDTEGFGAASVWEAFTTTECGMVTVSYCGTTAAFENYFIGIGVGCPLESVVENSGTDVTTCTDGNATVFFDDLPAGTYYYPVLMDETSTGPYTITVSAAACPGGYCTASANACDEYIAQVDFGTISNPSDCTDGPVVDYTTLSTDIAQSATLGITVLNGPNFYSSDQVAVWVDWDQNESFLDAGEAFALTSADGGATFIGGITVPANATLGQTRMRVRMMYTGIPSPCGTSPYGEVEDYSVNVVFGTPIDPPVNDECSSGTAEALASGSTITFTGTTEGATNTNDFEVGSDLEGEAATVWHAFTITGECNDVTVSYCNTDPAFGDVWAFLSPSCPAGNDYILSTSYNFVTCTSENATIVYLQLPAGTYYLPVIYNAVTANGPYSIDVSAVACVPDYCGASADLCDEYIAHVMFGTIDNASDCVNGSVVDYTAQSTNILQGMSITMTVLNGPAYYDGDQCTVWVDWNQDLDFVDAGEMFSLVSVGDSVFTGDITAPFDALLGSTRMRIRMMYTGTPSPCGGSAYGEVEDYTVNVDLSTGVSDLSEITWSVFPNPNNGDFTINYGGENDKVNIEVMDLTGRLVYAQGRTVNRGQQIVLPLAGNLSAGSYVLRLSGAYGATEQRFVVR